MSQQHTLPTHSALPFTSNSPRYSRRRLLQVGALGLSGLTLPKLLHAEQNAAGNFAPRADSCIMIFLNGGPSHLDMWDMKPDAPAEVRGEFKAIPSTLTGVPVCEHLPLLSKQMHRCALVRSMHHSVNNAHAAAVYVAMTGHDRGEIGGGFQPTDNPSPGSVLTLLRPSSREAVPYVALPYKTKEGAGGPPQPGFYGGWMGRSFDPLWVLKDPNAPDFSVPELSLEEDISVARLQRRGALLKNYNGMFFEQQDLAAFTAVNRFQERAADILTSEKVRAAFRLDEEAPEMREAYGRNIYGQSVLLARRMIEAGTRVATISWAPDANATWDTHGGNFKLMRSTLLPQFDAACGTLLQDLSDRGMLDRTLVAVLGDFGRTPKINANDGGRDHWNFCYSILLAGGGIRPGYVHGASDKLGAFPNDLPTTPADIIATIYRLLGVDHRQQLYDMFQRPHQIVANGQIVEALIA